MSLFIDWVLDRAMEYAGDGDEPAAAAGFRSGSSSSSSDNKYDAAPPEGLFAGRRAGRSSSASTSSAIEWNSLAGCKVMIFLLFVVVFIILYYLKVLMQENEVVKSELNRMATPQDVTDLCERTLRAEGLVDRA